MNSRPFETSDVQLDRLVDGELSPAEYRALLTSLEQDPQGWRRCALAFLEAQAWGRDFRAVKEVLPVAKEETATSRTEREERNALPTADSPIPNPLSAPAVGSRSTTKSRWHAINYWASLAASWLIVFGVGVLVTIRALPRGDDSIPNRNGNVTESGRAAPLSPAGAMGHLAGGAPAMSPQMVDLLVPGEAGQPERHVRLPIREVSDPNELLTFDSPAIAPHVTETIRQRTGREVRRHVDLMPMQLEDGRQLVVPMERYQFVPVRAAY